MRRELLVQIYENALSSDAVTVAEHGGGKASAKRTSFQTNKPDSASPRCFATEDSQASVCFPPIADVGLDPRSVLLVAITMPNSPGGRGSLIGCLTIATILALFIAAYLVVGLNAKPGNSVATKIQITNQH